MCNLNCYYVEERRLDSFFGLLRATQHCGSNKWLPTYRWLQSTVNLQSYSNIPKIESKVAVTCRHKTTESCEEVQKWSINSNPNLFKQKG